MIRQLLILPSLVIFYSSIHGQQKKLITVKAGHTIKESLTPADLYQYPQFDQGFVFLKNGKTAHSLLNYNHFLDNMEFLDSQGDTMSISNGKEIQLVTIGKDSFFYADGFVKLLSKYGHLTLAIKETLPIISREKMTDGYGSYSAINNVESYDSYSDGLKVYGLVQMQNLTLANKVQYYVAKDESSFIPATKKNILKLFPKQKDEAETYCKQNAIKFDKAEDLIKLMQYLSEL